MAQNLKSTPAEDERCGQSKVKEMGISWIYTALDLRLEFHTALAHLYKVKCLEKDMFGK